MSIEDYWKGRTKFQKLFMKDMLSWSIWKIKLEAPELVRLLERNLEVQKSRELMISQEKLQS